MYYERFLSLGLPPKHLINSLLYSQKFFTGIPEVVDFEKAELKIFKNFFECWFYYS